MLKKPLMKECDCIICGKHFKAYSSKSGKYCSVDCYRVAQRKGDYPTQKRTQPKKCEYCGTEIYRSYKHKRNGQQCDKVFCDRKCYDKFREIDKYRICPSCGISFLSSRSHSDIYCSDECWRKDTASHSVRFCVICGQMFIPWKYDKNKQGFILAGTVITCSDNCQKKYHEQNEVLRRDKISKAFTGDLHPNWMGGHGCYRGVGWPRAVRDARKRDNDTCQRCGMTKKQSLKKYRKNLEVHHIHPYREYNDDYVRANNLDNLITLCKSCHRITEAEYYKGIIWSPLKKSS